MARHALPVLVVLALLGVGCQHEILERDGAGEGLAPESLPAHRGDAPVEDPEPGDTPDPDAPGDPDPDTPDDEPAPACQVWSDCGPFYGDPASGYACEAGQCVCDPDGQAAESCALAGGTFRADLCYCQGAIGGDDGGAEQCQVWQDCGPHAGDPNSGFECVAGTCACDPEGQYVEACASLGGYWIAQECFCAFADTPPPNEDPGAGCFWHWEQPPCDPDRWVDTSHYEEECSYDASGEYVCESVWVESGYWEPGACPSGWWERRC